MMSLETIVAVNQEVAEKAASEKLVPYVPAGPSEIEQWSTLPFPSIGYYEPPGWKKTDAEWFVDKSGLGKEWEPALTLQQFKFELRGYALVHPGYGFAAVEEGEFQAMVAAFRPLYAEG